jgi:glyoxylase-like metal-dependent hydrolase (beta-lactamase superfamily II)
VKGFVHDQSNTICYLVYDDVNRKAAIIDSVLDFDPDTCSTGTGFAEKIVQAASENSLEIEWILETHCHADHLSASQFLKKRFPQAKSGIGGGITRTQETFRKIYNLDIAADGSQFDCLFADGDSFSIGPNLPVKVIATPGHTMDSVSYYVAEDSIFVGDTVFYPDSGTARCDFPNGDAGQLWKSASCDHFGFPF